MDHTTEEPLVEVTEATLPPTGAAPAFKAKHGAINVACWTEELSTKEGEAFTKYSVSIDRSYLVKDDKWQTSQALHVAGERDLINLSIAINDILGQVRSDRKSKAKK
jgi:hypothetical protein